MSSIYPPVRPFIGPTRPPVTQESFLRRAWPDLESPGRPRLVAAAVTLGVLTALLPIEDSAGIGLFLILVGVTAVVGRAYWPRATLESRSVIALMLLLLSTIALRDANWAVLLCALAAMTLAASTLTGARTVAQMFLSPFAVLFGSLRSLPWFGRSLGRLARGKQVWPIAKTIALSALLLIIFGALFASADAVFANWTSTVIPAFDLGDLPARVAFGGALAAGTLAATFVAIEPPSIAQFTREPKEAKRFEWAVPVGIVVAVFIAFLAAQLTAMFGGHDYLQRTTGLTYAEYVHQGFGQLTVATAVVLLIVGITARRAPRHTSGDRLLLRVLLGGLCLLTLVVVASALYRIHLYDQAYGFTELRLVVVVFELWLGIVLLLVAFAGVRLRGRWVPKAAVLAGAVMLLGMTLANPDAIVAQRNVDRFAETGKIDWIYLSTLSDDAVPALSELPEPVRSCTLKDRDPSGSWLAWNWGRSQASKVLAEHPVVSGTNCSLVPSN